MRRRAAAGQPIRELGASVHHEASSRKLDDKQRPMEYDTAMEEKRNSSLSPGRLLILGILRVLVALTVIGAIFFGTAGTLRYMNGWIYLGTFILLMGAGLSILFVKDKALFEKRMRTNERDKSQRIFVIISSILITMTFTIPGLDYRFGWSRVPIWLVIVGDTVLAFSYILYVVVMWQNRYASRVVEIQKEQKLIDTGLYGVVRHPMYMAMTIVYLATPVVLGSYWALIPMILFPVLLGYRAVNEEKLLREGLPGYEEYMRKVKYRIIPFVW